MNNIKIDRATNSKKFVGYKICKNYIQVTIPPMLYIPENNEKEMKKILLNFIRSIQLAKKIKFEDYENGCIDQEEMLWDIDSYLWLIHDYLENGMLFISKNNFANEIRGKVNWKRTLKMSPIISKGNVIYDKLIINRKVNVSSKITEVYKFCLEICIKRIGWLFDYSFSTNCLNPPSFNEMVSLVNQFQRITYDDIGKERLRIMKNILLEYGGHKSRIQNQTYGIKHYHFIFESMIDILYGNINDKSKYRPLTEWHIAGETKTNSHLRPDTIMKIGNIVYVIDSKMYNYGVESVGKNLPDSQTIQKQITYSEYISKIIDDVNVKNVFFIPYNKKKDNASGFNKDIEYFGYALTNWKDIELEPYSIILGMFIDLAYLLENYKKGTEKKRFEISKYFDKSFNEANKEFQIQS